MEPGEDYEITVAVEALRDLQSHSKEGPETSNANGSVSTATKVATASPASVSDDTITPHAVIKDDKVTAKQVSGQTEPQKRGKKRETIAKNSQHNTLQTAEGAHLPSHLQTVALAFPLRDSQKKRILLPKPTSSSSVINIPLSSIISQTIGMPESVQSKRRAVAVPSTGPSGEVEQKNATKIKERRRFACTTCSTETTTRQALWKHKRRFHSDEPKEGRTAERVNCDECNTFCCKTLKELLLHYNKAHGKKLRVLCKKFASEREFEEWKKQTEKMCGSWFVLSNGKKVYAHHTTRYYYCNRSGFSKGKGIRTSKRAAKIEGKCCAYMRKKQDSDTGQVTVEYSLDHVGHVTKLSLSLLPAGISNTITTWHSSGDDADSVMSQIHAKAMGLETVPVTLPDSLARLKQSHIPKDQHKRDSLTRMVTELRSRKDNPVLIYKPQGDVEHDMSSEDFVIGIQTHFQRETLKKHASKMICAHVSQRDDSFFMMLLVIDEESEVSVPVCFLLGSIQEGRLFKPFLEALKAKCGDIETDLFVTNLSSKMYHMWTDTFSKPWRKLDCSWHVDEDWRNNLQSYIPDIENQLVVYAYLKTLQYEGDEIHFRKVLQEFMIFLGEVSPGFKCYFSNNYLLGERSSHWAVCLCKGLLSHKSNLDGTFYKGIKDVFSQCLQYWRSTDLLLVLLKLSRDLAVIHSSRQTRKGRSPQTAREMKSHHSRSTMLQCDYFTVGDGEWSVSSPSDPSVNFVIRKLLDSCHCNLHCEVCSVCTHLFSCSCLEFLLGPSGCEHIHFIHMANEGDRSTVGEPMPSLQENPKDTSLQSHLLETDGDSSIKYLRKEATRKLKDLEKQLKNVTDEEVLRRICGEIDVALATAGEVHDLGDSNVTSLNSDPLTFCTLGEG